MLYGTLLFRHVLLVEKKIKKIFYWLSVLFPIVIYKIKKAKQNYSQKIYFFRKIYNTQASFFYIGIRTI